MSQRGVGSTTVTAEGGGASEDVDSSVGERAERAGSLGNQRKEPLAGGQHGCRCRRARWATPRGRPFARGPHSRA